MPDLRPPLDHTISYIAMERDAELLARFRPGELAGPAMHYIQRQINEKLKEHNVTSRLLWDSRHTRLGLHIVPRSLIGRIWLQFARAIDGNRAFRRCQDCRKWFEVTPHVTRTDRIFCSPTCKASAHRGKIAEARRLFARGVSPREIARQLASTTDKVEGWVQG